MTLTPKVWNDERLGEIVAAVERLNYAFENAGIGPVMGITLSAEGMERLEFLSLYLMTVPNENKDAGVQIMGIPITVEAGG